MVIEAGKGTLPCIAQASEVTISHQGIALNVRLHVVEDAGHFFRDLFADEVADTITEFAGGGS